MTSNPLVAFLTAQIDERERIARAAIPDGGSGDWPWGCPHEGMDQKPPSHDMCAHIGSADTEIQIYDEGGHSITQAQHITLNDPAAVLADIASKRLILSMHAPSASGYECIPCVELDADGYPIPWPCPTMRALATAFRHADGYRAEWAYDA